MWSSQKLRFNKSVQKNCQMIFTKLVLWYLNHISTMEKKTDRVKSIVQVKPENSQDVLCWEHLQRQGTIHGVDLFSFCAKEKPHLQWMDEWVGRWTMRKKSGRTWGLWSSSCTDVEKKWHGWKQISGVNPSHCFMIHLQMEISAAEGSREASPLFLQL